MNSSMIIFDYTNFDTIKSLIYELPITRLARNIVRDILRSEGKDDCHEKV